MKKLLFCLSALCAVACTEGIEEDVTLNTTNTGAVSFEAVMTTRATDTEFEDGDEASVMAYDSDGSIYADNVLYQYSGGIFSSDTPIMKLNASDEISYLAVYPYTTIDEEKKVNFSVKEDQSYENNYTLSDLLSSSVEPTTTTSPQFIFTHLLSKFVINLESSDVTTDDAVAILNLLTDVEYDLGTSEYTSSGTAKAITMAANDETSFKALVVPQVIEANTNFGSITVGGTVYEFIFSSKITIENGYVYTLNATIVGDKITFSNATINDWNEGVLEEEEEDIPALGATDYYQGIGRIALSSDGNMHDNDDKAACMMTLMILAKAGLQDQTTLYTYCDHVWGSEGTDVEDMKGAVNGASERFGFNACNLICAVEDPESAYDAMAAEIAKSTVTNPLFILAAGPMHVVGTGFERADEINPEALNYVTIISHSTWNNKHSDNYTSDSESPHEGWTWDEMTAAFGDRVNFNYISDQNGTEGDDGNVYTTKDKFSAPDWTYWAWMSTHADENINWVYDYAKNQVYVGPDFSDAGMAYYLVADLNGERGDEMGNPVKLEEWIGPDPIPVDPDETLVWSIALDESELKLSAVGDTFQLTATILPTTAADKSVTWTSSQESVATVSESGLVTAVGTGTVTITAKSVNGKLATCTFTVGEAEAGDVVVGEDFIVFEAESTKSALGSNWVIVKEGDANYDGIKGDLPAFGGAYIETTTGDVAGLQATAGEDMLQYVFTPATSGTYRLTGRMAQRLDAYSGTAWDKCNDIYIKMEGNFTATGNSSDATLAQLTSWHKYYGRGHVDASYGSWGAFTKLNIGESSYNANYVLVAGEEYTLSISARSMGCCIDYFLLYKTSLGLTVSEKVDIATANDERYWPTSNEVATYIYESYTASSFDILTSSTGTSIASSDFATAVVDWKDNSWLGIATALKWGAAETTYEGVDGDVNIFINTVLETDGESSYKVYVDNVMVGEVTNPRIYDTDTEEYTIQVNKLTDDKITIANGATIRVEFNSATNGFVPEDDSTATSRGRWASVVVTTADSISTDDSGSGDSGDSGSTGGGGTIVVVPGSSESGTTDVGTTGDPVYYSYDMPTAVALGTTTIPLTFTYTSTEVTDFCVTVHDMTNSVTSGFGFVKVEDVPAGENVTLTIDFPVESTLVEDVDYRWSVYFNPQDGTWSDTYTSTKVNIYFGMYDPADYAE
ncbi:MAG: fimbrillin family protein [Rikenellaceae bacterium]